MASKIRILIIAPGFGSIYRGVEVFAQELACRIDKQRYQITILSGKHDSPLDEVECVQMPMLRRSRIPKWIHRALSLLPKRLHLGCSEIESLTLMCNSKKFLKSRTFDLILPFGGTWSYRFARNSCKGSTIISIGHSGPTASDLKLSDFFVALTPTDQEFVESVNPHIKSAIIPNGVDIDRFYNNPKLFPKFGTKTILCVAALTSDKRHDLLFNAMMLLDSDIHLICVGEGPLLDTLQQHPLYEKGRVSFTVKSYDEMPDVYKLADTFTLPSPGEAFGLVFLEALASGIPVVAHDSQRQRYVIGATGIFCNVYDPESYAHALKQALQLRPDENRSLHAKGFEWEKVIAQYDRLFQQLLTENTL